MNPHLPSSIELSSPVLRVPFAAQLRTGRGYCSAWGVSCLAHGFLVVVALWGGAQVVEAPRPPIRLVFAEPPPPPPAPMNVAVATATTPTVERPPTVVKKPQPQTPKRKEPKRPKIVKAKRIQEPPKQLPLEPVIPPQAETAPETTPPTEAAPVEPASTASVTNVDNNGVVGGEVGGHVGGVIGGQGTRPLPADQVTNPPLLLARVTPDYPRQARRQGIEGLVLLEAILDLEGRIEGDVKVLRSIPVLDGVAVRALRQWRFRPARDHENRPVRVILEVPVRFVLR